MCITLNLISIRAWYNKNVSQLLLVLSGFDSHSVQYMQKAHATRERFAIFSEHYIKLSKFERILK